MSIRIAGLAILVLVSACASSYRGDFADRGAPWPLPHHRIGCLDVSVASHADQAAEGIAVRYRFANRCEGAVRVDLAAAVVTGRDERGREVRLAVYDPIGEVRSTVLDGLHGGTEVLEYQPTELDVRLVSACFDIRAITAEPAGASVAITCVAARGGSVVSP